MLDSIFIKKTLIAFILQMLFVIMHEEFALKTAHLIQHTDIRHIDYLNKVPSVSRKKIIRRGMYMYYEIYFIFKK